MKHNTFLCINSFIVQGVKLQVFPLKTTQIFKKNPIAKMFYRLNQSKDFKTLKFAQYMIRLSF